MDTVANPANLVDPCSSHLPTSPKKKEVLLQFYTDGSSLITISVHLCCLLDNLKPIILSLWQSTYV